MSLHFKSCIFILLCAFCLGAACKKSEGDSQKNSVLQKDFAKGADVSWLTEMEASGKKFYNSAGVQQDCFDVLKGKGMNAIRLRVWVNPKDGWNSKADVVSKAIRAKNKGFRIMIDFHYSDTWADPGHQVKPAAWENLDLPDLKKAVFEHTYDVLKSMKEIGIIPEWVQTGNEVNDGFLWPTGQISVSDPANYASLINSAYDAVKAVDTSIKTILHISNGFDNNLFRWNLDNLKKNGGKWDITGMSSYPPVAGWRAHNESVFSNMKDMVSRYGKPVLIAEVGMAVNEPQAAKEMLMDLIAKTRSLGTNGLGVFYWEPEAYDWKHYGMGAFDNNGTPTVAMDAFL